MYAVDLVGRVRQLAKLPDSALADLLSDGAASWGLHEENTANLLEIQAYQLELAWIDRTTDPDDPEVKRERLRAERDGIRPPKRPIVPPVALRPESLAEKRFELYLERLSEIQSTRVKDQVSSDEFDRLMGLI